MHWKSNIFQNLIFLKRWYSHAYMFFYWLIEYLQVNRMCITCFWSYRKMVRNAAYANENEISSKTWYSLCTTFCKDEFRALSSIWGGAFCENNWLRAVESCYHKKVHLGGSEHASSFAKLYIWKGVGSSE